MLWSNLWQFSFFVVWMEWGKKDLQKHIIMWSRHMEGQSLCTIRKIKITGYAEKKTLHLDVNVHYLICDEMLPVQTKNLHF